MFMPANRVIALGIYWSYCILRHQILTELIFGGHDVCQPQPPGIHLPKGWQGCMKSAVLHAIGLAHYAYGAKNLTSRKILLSRNIMDNLFEQ